MGYRRSVWRSQEVLGEEWRCWKMYNVFLANYREYNVITIQGLYIRLKKTFIYNRGCHWRSNLKVIRHRYSSSANTISRTSTKAAHDATRSDYALLTTRKTLACETETSTTRLGQDSRRKPMLLTSSKSSSNEFDSNTEKTVSIMTMAGESCVSFCLWFLFVPRYYWSNYFLRPRFRGSCHS